MNIKDYIPRIVDKEINDLIATYGAVSIEGPKYCGKTWTSMRHASSIFALDDPDGNYRNLRMASMDPNAALEGGKPHLIDEWQLVPATWDAVRRRVDLNPGPGQYILSGSSVPAESGSEDPIERIRGGNLHSGFGRIATVRMRTMTLMESGLSDGRVRLGDLFDLNVPTSICETNSIDGIIDMVMCGGWPGNLRLDPDHRILAVSRYPDEICEKDLPRIDSTKSPYKMKMLLRSLSRNESTLAKYTTIAAGMKEYDDESMTDETVKSYISVLERMHLIENQPAFNPNLRSSVRVGKSPKRHLTDPALAIASMELSKKMLLDDLELFGFMFEAMCERDLQVYANSMGGRLYHYRDGSGRKIDAIVELPDGRWGAFEIKLGANQIDDAADDLLDVGRMIANDENGRPPEFMCVISGTGGATYRREDGVLVVPITSLGCRSGRTPLGGSIDGFCLPFQMMLYP